MKNSYVARSATISTRHALSLFLLFCTALQFAACSGDDNPPNPDIACTHDCPTDLGDADLADVPDLVDDGGGGGGERSSFSLVSSPLKCWNSMGDSTTVRVGGNCGASIGVDYDNAEFDEPIILSVVEDLPPGVTAEFTYVEQDGIVPRTSASFDLRIRGAAPAGPLTFHVRGTTTSYGSSTLTFSIEITSLPGFPLASVSVGHETACGLDEHGQAFCWGDNVSGQLGLGTNGVTGTDFERKRPVAAAGDLRFTRIAVGTEITCALDDAGQAYCWGRGWLGDGNNHGPGTLPTLVAGGHTFVDIVLNSASICGLTTTGSIYCWAGGNGYLGDGTFNTGAVPTDVSGGRTYETIAAAGGGQHVCALATGGTPYCWGNNTFNQTGAGSPLFIFSPTAVQTTVDFHTIAVSIFASCGLTDGGDVYCWGHNSTGDLGLGQFDSERRPSPTLVPGGVRFSTLVGGAAGFCGLDEQGSLYCWGFAGTESHRAVSSVTEHLGELTFSQIAVGSKFSCGIATNGLQATYCWGSGLGRYPGTGDDETYYGPVPIAQP